ARLAASLMSRAPVCPPPPSLPAPAGRPRRWRLGLTRALGYTLAFVVGLAVAKQLISSVPATEADTAEAGEAPSEAAAPPPAPAPALDPVDDPEPVIPRDASPTAAPHVHPTAIAPASPSTTPHGLEGAPPWLSPQPPALG